MNLKLTGVQKVLNDLAKLDSQVTAMVDGELEAGANDMARIAQQLAPANFGQLKNSISSSKVGPLRYTFFAEIKKAPHAPFIEFGTVKKVNVPAELQDVAMQFKGKKRQGTWKTFIEDIYLWGTKKGIIKKGDRGHARAIARRIYMNGIAPQPYLWPAFLTVRPKLIQRLRAEIDRIKL